MTLSTDPIEAPKVDAFVARASKRAAEHYSDSPSQSWWREANGAFVNHYFVLTESSGGWFVRRHHGATLNREHPLPSLLVAQCFADEVLMADAQNLFAEVWDALETFRDTILNQRGLLAENGMTSEQVNDVLGEFDAVLNAAERLL